MVRRIAFLVVVWLGVVFYVTGSTDDTSAFARQIGGAGAGGLGTAVGSMPGWVAQFRTNQEAARKSGGTPVTPPSTPPAAP